ncbi:acyltransferase [Actinocorallia sp. A-T 12471]|uniref:acyltransferase family protein n=1 Tax=Actinocorallia sp. A-T 12471 TaxID=3089813 RepID=UPI0029CE4725|nr:acyltransferase [Actinocorallia sp. A-T 12471]MDX6743822.1 acyltransferase [Actinocorallia sp. A-T 12471]
MADAPRVPTGHLDALDGLRTVAIALVVCSHVVAPTGMLGLDGLHWRMLNMGGVGVPIFFVLSGYLLYRPYARATLDGTPAPNTRDFLFRRAMRILPAYWVMLPFAMVFFNRDVIGDVWLWLQLITLTHNFDLYPPWDLGDSGLPALGPIWSLSVEATFYVLLPLLAAALRRFSRGEPRRLLLGIGALFTLSLAEAIGVRFVEYTHGVFGIDPIELMFYNERLLPRSFLLFAAGMALAVLAERPTPLTTAIGASPALGWTIALCGLALVSTPLARPLADGAQTAPQYIAQTLLFLLIALALVAPTALAPHHPLTTLLLSTPPMRALGRVSYGVFLWHIVVMDAWYALTGRDLFKLDFWLVLSVTLLFSLILATLSHTFLEHPAQQFARHHTRPPKLPVPEKSPTHP